MYCNYTTDNKKSIAKPQELLQLSDMSIEIYDGLFDKRREGNPNDLQNDALRVCPGLIYKLRFEETVSIEELKVIDEFMNQFYQYGYLPRKPHEGIPTDTHEYVTAMDAPLLGISCQLAYERTGNKKYKEDLSLFSMGKTLEAHPKIL